MTQDEFELLLTRLTNIITYNKPTFDVIVSICNGGLHIGQPLAQTLNLPHRKVQITRYHGPLTIQAIDYQPSEWQNPLVVDDLTDNGTTLKLFQQHFGKATFAVLLHNFNIFPEPKFFASYKPNAWVVFPWENYD